MIPRLSPRAVALALVSVALAACSGCWAGPPTRGLAPAQPPSSNPSAPADAVLFGDSLSAWGQGTIEPLWATQQPLSLSYNARSGAEASDWLPWMADVAAGQCVIYAIGTNDTSRHTAVEAEWRTLAAFNELADADTLVVLTLNTTSNDLRGTPFSSRVRHYNAWLRTLYVNGTYPNLVLVEWDDISRGHPEYLTADKLHHTDAGNAAYAQTIVDAGTWC